MKKELIIKQEGNKDCGASCLLSVIRYYDGNISKERLLELTKTTKEGTNFYSLSIAASKVGLMTKSFKVDNIDKLKNINSPFIAHIATKNYTHFVVVYKVDDTKITIMDPAKGKVTANIFDFASNFTGNIMLFEKTSSLPKYQNKNILLNVIIDVLIKNKAIIVFLIILSLIFTVITCITSLYSQVIFDKIIDTNIDKLFIITYKLDIFLRSIYFKYYYKLYKKLFVNLFKSKIRYKHNINFL